jgi:hypothetical protein
MENLNHIKPDEKNFMRYPDWFETWVANEFNSDNWHFPEARLIDMLAKAYNLGVSKEEQSH